MQEELKEILNGLLNNLLKEIENNSTTKQWLSLKEACDYAGVSYNTLMKFRLHNGLKIAEINGVKRVSKTEIDNFFNENSF
ncbi:helix-turn-helix domain-containing protein [Psychrobacillus soli]|uniref:Helix-turn-helix domain-containing protein n=1 Tax=Psychrobacillus soli TaxID=1543965 RepID=A0A544TBI7_9BACI|nr:helix-turn-helix domain-containing protein [Psychrobacillus soli]TQR14756.1 helix-turn-helix domain-containing protein [Psychrobacillus soli]